MDNRPIGIFDSGIGGLTVLKELMEQFPNEKLIYFGDTARIPYGTKSKEAVIKYSFQCIRFLLSKNVKTIIIACNTASAVALEPALKEFDLPILGVVKSGSKAAVKETQNDKIGVIGTTGTINSYAYQREIRTISPSAEVIGQACPLFVQIVEDGWEDTEVAKLTAEKYLIDMKEHDVDTLVLGCTHYPILRYTLKKVLGEEVKLINPAYETAKESLELLTERKLLTESSDIHEVEFYVSDDAEKFRRIGGNMLNRNIKSVKKIEIEGL
ncbi:MAG: glutamate racemase [Andreesenia angusta]|nr:glutamate racemase [Andreesenia angusta]